MFTGGEARGGVRKKKKAGKLCSQDLSSLFVLASASSPPQSVAIDVDGRADVSDGGRRFCVHLGVVSEVGMGG